MTIASSSALSSRNVDPRSSRDLDTIADLHMELLHFGPMAQLGREFVREVCYRLPLEFGSIRGVVYEYDGRGAGFVAFTDEPNTFYRSALRNHWLRVSRLLVTSILRDPRRLRYLPRIAQVVLSRQNEQAGEVDAVGEVLCIAVRPEFLTSQFVRDTGTSLGEDLMHRALAMLRSLGVKKVRALVDVDNKAPIFLYHRMGAEIHRCEFGGQVAIRVMFDLETAYADSVSPLSIT